MPLISFRELVEFSLFIALFHLNLYRFFWIYIIQLLISALYFYKIRCVQKYLRESLILYFTTSFTKKTFFFFFAAILWLMEVPRMGLTWSCSCSPTPQPQQHCIWATAETYAAACGNARSLAHWARLGIKPASSWRLCQFLNPLSDNGNSKKIFWYTTMDKLLCTTQNITVNKENCLEVK